MKTKFNSVKMGLAGLVLSAATIFPSQSQELPVKYLDKLMVNNDSTYTTIVHRSEKEGVEDMRELTKTSKVEEAWVFLPDWNLWYEVGKKGRDYEKVNGDYSLFLELDVPKIDELMKENDNLILYHFHPEFIPEEIYKNISRQSVVVQTSLPPKPDLMSGIILEKTFSSHHKNGKIKFGIASKEGVTEFYLTKGGRERYKNLSNSTLNSVVIKPKFKWCSDFKESDENLSERIKKIAKSMSDENLTIEFKTYEEYFSEFNK